VVAVGVVLIPLPGPGWAIVILGLAILAVEFTWARGLLDFTRRHVTSWTHWVTRRSVPVRALLGVAGFNFVALIVWATVRLSFGVDVAAVVLDWVKTR
jgi:uncharacterized protein (TIGR02611 family)